MKTNNSRHYHEDFPLIEPGVFQSLYNNRHIAVYRFIYGLHGGPKEEVEDLTMKTFLRAWRSRSRFQGHEEAAFGWLLIIARNLVIDHQRRRSNRQYDLDIESQVIPSPGLTPEEMLFLKEQTHTLWTIIKTFPYEQREIIVLRYILGWRVKDIGHHLDMSENHVSVTIRRILKAIKNKWSEHE